MLENIDTFLLDRAQRFTEWFQQWTGLSKFWLEKATTILWALLLCVHTGTVIDSDPIVAAPALLTVVFAWLGVLSVEREESNFLCDGRLRMSPFNTWYFWLLVLATCMEVGILDLIDVLQHDSSVSLSLDASAASCALMVYIATCTPKPPGRSRFLQIRERLRSRLSSALSLDQKPSPA